MVDVMTRRETWTEYVQRITAGVPRKDVAAAVGIHVSGLGRWLNDPDRRPSAEKVVAFARALGQPPVEALIAADYLHADEVTGVIEVVWSRSEIPDQELLGEIAKRLAERPSRPDVDAVTPRLTRPDDPR